MAGAQRRRQGSNPRHRIKEEAEIVQQKSSFPLRISIIAFFVVPLVLFLVWRLFPSPKTGGDVSYYKHILQEVASPPAGNSTHRNLDGMVLAYVTPWNSKGYKMAEKYRAKFTHVSPVWYQLKSELSRDLSLTGRHDVDQRWISNVRKHGSPLIVPRVILEGWGVHDMISEPEVKKQAINLIVNECKEMLYNGVVLEAWNSWTFSRILQNKTLRQKALEFIRDMGSALHGSSMQLILVIPPNRGGNTEEFTGDDLGFLSDSIDGFSLMTYDFSNAYQPGPNAPLSWIRSSINSLLPPKPGKKPPASKIMLGINFYGNDYMLPQGGGAILGDQFLELLQQHKPELKWDSKSHEHFFDYTLKHQKHRVYYPTPASLRVRLNESRVAGTGVSIWEIGQGLEIFFHFL